MYFICHVASHEHLIDGSYEFMDGNFLRYVTTQVSLVTMSIEIMWNIVFNLSRNFSWTMFKGLCEFMVGTIIQNHRWCNIFCVHTYFGMLFEGFFVINCWNWYLRTLLWILPSSVWFVQFDNVTWTQKRSLCLWKMVKFRGRLLKNRSSSTLRLFSSLTNLSLLFMLKIFPGYCFFGGRY